MDNTLTYLLHRATELYAGIPEGLQDRRVVTLVALNVRNGPGPDFRWVRLLHGGDRVNVIGTSGNWAQIGLYEWVHAGYLKKI